MPTAGDVVTVDFVGATGIKRRPAVVVSSDAYHRERPDIILGVITSNTAAAASSTDCILVDWKLAGLRAPSAFRAYLGMAVQSAVRPVGRLSPSDWLAVQNCVKRALA